MGWKVTEGAEFSRLLKEAHERAERMTPEEKQAELQALIEHDKARAERVIAYERGERPSPRRDLGEA